MYVFFSKSISSKSRCYPQFQLIRALIEGPYIYGNRLQRCLQGRYYQCTPVTPLCHLNLFDITVVYLDSTCLSFCCLYPTTYRRILTFLRERGSRIRCLRGSRRFIEGPESITGVDFMPPPPSILYMHNAHMLIKNFQVWVS